MIEVVVYSTVLTAFLGPKVEISDRFVSNVSTLHITEHFGGERQGA